MTTPSHRLVTLSLTALCVLWLSGVFAASQQPPRQSADPPRPDAQAQIATINQYCAACHNDRTRTGGVSFDGLTAENIGQRAELMEKAVRKLRGRVMPPPGSRQPASAAVDSLVAWLETSLDRAATRSHIPDRVVLHRLNRKEYGNAVRDLLGIEIEANTMLPADDVANGFDNIAAALQVSPSFIEQYVVAARAVAVK